MNKAREEEIELTVDAFVDSGDFIPLALELFDTVRGNTRSYIISYAAPEPRFQILHSALSDHVSDSHLLASYNECCRINLGLGYISAASLMTFR